ncbi:hypothetical protein [Paenibacillus sp. NPDC058071]|uniref:hypothetical protein n=1 Tax=Paenibacillus sp. NPDC058071 TaxID=3346326 RepID=UPI0036DE52D6
MKKIIAGGIVLLSGVILFLGIYIPMSFHASKLGGWTTPPGRLGTALNEMGGATAFNYSIIMIICGIFLLLWGCFEEEIKRTIKKIVHYNKTLQ